MTDLIRQDDYWLDPVTGELIAPDAPYETVAALVVHIRETESLLRSMKAEASERLIAEMDREAKWSGRVGDFVVSTRSPAPTIEYDADLLYDVLCELRDGGDITTQAVDNAVRETTTRKVMRGGVNALLKLGGKVAEEIRACGTETQPRRTVKIEEAR